MVVLVVADYRPSPLGGWAVTVDVEGVSAMGAHFLGAHEAYHGVRDLLEELVEEADCPLATVHTLDGDPAAWAMLAAREGFGDCEGAGLSGRGGLL